MTIPILIAFFVACALGAVAAWRARLDDGRPLVSALQMLSSAMLIGALIVAAEAGSSVARTLGLLAIVAGSASLCGGFIAARRLGTSLKP
ncbi:proton-translocating transhydrogenase family protein [Sphingobium sp. JS3065]|uniref:proton-translocating transhydrogenase family protein n=1 Tax=Sphingobium sp. JS3065 TaxID=2970925 RepID=UPI002264B1D0|nr:proton-translocating transhydrogenase family protein [Sphingobium sp. JS3065]UZW55122.1 proton-translocating transhydrogenase family protein [Sphingobium sp. JS3065]